MQRLPICARCTLQRKLCDRCVLIDKGKVAFDGDTDQAIALYLGATEAMPTTIMFGPEHRPHDHIIRAVKRLTLESLTLTNKPEPSFRSSEEALLDIQCTAEEPLHNLGFRFELWYQDGSKVASSMSGNFVDLEPGACTLRLRLPMRHLVPGQYRADIVAFLYDDSTIEYMVDAVYPGFTFQVEPVVDKNNYLEWKPRYWGAVRLDDLTLERLD